MEQFIRSNTLTLLAEALLKAKDKFDPVLKDTKNPLYNSKYADLSGIIEATEPHLAANGLVIIQSPVGTENLTGVITLLLHTSGEFVQGTLFLPANAPGKGGTTRLDVQTACSSITFARRYSYKSILGISEKDDDGNAAVGYDRPQPGRPKATQTSKTTKPESKQAPNTPSTSKLEPSEPSLPVGQPEPQPSEDRAPEAPETTKTENVTILPNKAEFDAYIKRAKEVAFGLAKAGMPVKDGVAVGVQLVKFITTVTGYESLAAIPKDKWEGLIVKLESGLNTDVQTLIKIINERIA